MESTGHGTWQADLALTDELQSIFACAAPGTSTSTTSSSTALLEDFFHASASSEADQLLWEHNAPTYSANSGSDKRKAEQEDNYERKKKRAKLNRQDLNSQFQRLMKLLHLQEDRKVNRAKIVGKAIEHIEKQDAEIKELRRQLNASKSREEPVKKTSPMVWNGLPPMSLWMPLDPRLCALKKRRKVVVEERKGLEWVAREVPTLLCLCDAWTVRSVMQVSKSMYKQSANKELWRRLCRKRWKALGVEHASNPQRLWKKWHNENKMPFCSSIGDEQRRVASAYADGVGVWALLSRRSNGRTSRSVLEDGRAVVKQVVHLYVVVQSHLHRPVQIESVPRVFDKAEKDFPSVQQGPFAPSVVEWNDSVLSDERVELQRLHQGDVCVVSLFIECSGVDEEEVFLQRLGGVDMRLSNGASVRAIVEATWTKSD